MRPADPTLVDTALRSVRSWTPDLAPDDRYVEIHTLVAGGLAGRIARRLGGAPERVGESALVMGLSSRLWALTVVPLVTHGVVVDPAVIVARDDDGALTLGVRGPQGFTDVSPDDLARIVLELLEPVVDALSLAPRLLWGNVAASLYAAPRVERLRRAAPVAADLLARPPLVGQLDPSSTPPGRRRTCCLFYLADGAGLCGDCVFTEIPGRAPA